MIKETSNSKENSPHHPRPEIFADQYKSPSHPVQEYLRGIQASISSCAYVCWYMGAGYNLIDYSIMEYQRLRCQDSLLHVHLTNSLPSPWPLAMPQGQYHPCLIGLSPEAPGVPPILRHRMPFQDAWNAVRCCIIINMLILRQLALMSHHAYITRPAYT